MGDGDERIRHRESLAKVMTAREAAGLFRDGMMVATSGSTMGFPKATFGALAERIKAEGGLKIDLLCAGPLSSEFEDILFEAGGIRKRIGAVGGAKLRGGINRGEVTFIEGKGSSLPLQVKRGWFGPLDMAVIEAVGLTEDGQIIPSTAVYDAQEWIEAASQVIVEINLNRPLSLEGLHDVCPRGDDPIPVVVGNPLKRIGVPYFPVDPRKIKAIVTSDLGDKPSKEAKPDTMGAVIGLYLVDFFRKEIAAGRLNESLPPLELGFGELFGNMMRKIGESGFKNFRFHLPMVSDPVFELVAAGKVDWVAGIALRLSAEAWKRFEQEPGRYKKFMVLRPVTVNGCAELIQRMGVVAINGCLEMDLLGQVNSSHVLGTKIMAGIGGTYDYSRNSLYSIFIARSTTKGGDISSIVPRVSHVDHTMHDVDVLVTEQGLADLRGLDPRERAAEIIGKCAHPDYKEMLSDYLERAKKEPGHIPVLMEEAGSFHARFKRTGSMKE
ncbi:MAG: acetyl-CoA hydrolase/transferase C-terminal domain-containing protein [Syntrophales bacterium]|nr:acetyl-CoA hydrolase/transferase C-terminal domain-containing protein [Syntrophales bacterium]